MYIKFEYTLYSYILYNGLVFYDFNINITIKYILLLDYNIFVCINLLKCIYYGYIFI